jgi:hypothetical protein
MMLQYARDKFPGVFDVFGPYIQPFEEWTFRDWVNFLFSGLGITFFALLLGAAFWIIRSIREARARASNRRSLQGKFPDYRVRLACFEDLERVHQFIRANLGDTIAPLSNWYERFRKNPSTTFLVERLERTPDVERRELRGVFTVIPVTLEAMGLLAKNELNAVAFSPQHIVSTRKDASAIYVSVILGKDDVGKALAIRSLTDKLNAPSARRLPVFTRPTTKDGLRLAKKFGFQPVAAMFSDASYVVHRLR